MKELLNSDQRRSVAIALRIFEENLRFTQNWLDANQENGILYQRGLRLPPELRQAAHDQISAALEKIAALSDELGLQPEWDDPAGMIRGKLNISWANLLDTQSVKLKRYGKVDQRLQERFDPAIQQLAQMALQLAGLFENPTDKTNGGTLDE